MTDNKRILQHPKFGEIQFKKVPRSRSIRISIKQEPCSVLITLPVYESFTNAELFLYQNAEWVSATLEKVKKRKEANQTKFTPETDFGTYSRKLQLIPEARTNVRVQILPETVFIYYPANRSIQDETLQSVIRKAVEHAWKVEAHEVLPQQVAQLAGHYNFSYKTLLLKNTRSYWGLCTPDNTITLNIHLMHLPLHLIDYIILHELCHTVHKNHGPRFWELLNQLTNGKARLLAKEMRKYNPRIY